MEYSIIINGVLSPLQARTEVDKNQNAQGGEGKELNPDNTGQEITGEQTLEWPRFVTFVVAV